MVTTAAPDARPSRAGHAFPLAGLLAALLAASAAAAAAGEAPPDTGAPPERATATFAGGCFWCVEEAFDAVEGVVETTSGFTGGNVPDPTYEQVSAGGTGHVEAVRVVYDPGVVSYRELLAVFWRNVDPTDAGGQFCDRGPSYRSAIFAHDDDQRAAAEASRRRIEREHDLDVVTPVREAGPFTPADAAHQDYHRRNPLRYELYKWRCGREARLRELWGADAP